MKTTVPAAYKELRANEDWSDTGLTIYALNEIVEGQLGYSVDPSGKDLTGPDRWHAEWIVIGHENLCGDPIFIDVRNTNLPVFTAMHGAGTWDEVLIAQSAAVFFESLAVVKRIQSGTLDGEEGLARIAEMNEGSDIDLDSWTILLE